MKWTIIEGSMAVSESYLTFVLEQLDSIRNLVSRRMFGGVGLYSGDLFFGLLDNDRLYLKVDQSNVGDYTRAGMAPFQPYPDQAVTMKYYEVPVSVLEDRDELAIWASRAMQVAAGARCEPRRSRRGRRES